MNSPLAGARLQTLVWSADIARSEKFFSDMLGLELNHRSHGALVYSVGQGVLRVSPVPSMAPSEHTVFGFEVDDIEPAVAALVATDLSFECFPGFTHDESGIWTAPDGTKVAWFRDPDGNLISIVEYARR